MIEVAIQGLPTSAAEADRLALRLGLRFEKITLHQFPDNEMRVTVGPAASTTIIYSSLDQPNDKLIAILFAAEALRRNGSKRLVLLAPYLCYMRQDAPFHPGEAISQRAMGRLIAATVDRVITVDAHLHRTTEISAVFPGIEAENLSATPAIANALGKTGLDPATIVVGPDAESRPWVSQLARQLGLAYTIGQKSRRGDRTVEIEFLDPASLVGRPVLLIDDIVSSGGTLMTCARALKAAGAETIDVVITHALFAPEMMTEFTKAGIRTIRSTCSVPHPTNAIPLDQLFVEALRREIDHSTITETRP